MKVQRLPYTTCLASAIRQNKGITQNVKYAANFSYIQQTRFNSTHTGAFGSLGTPIFQNSAFKQFVDSCVKSYESSKGETDSVMSEILRGHNLVLLMEGTMDKPKSLCAANIAKMFTLLQIDDLHTVDVLSNKEVFGYLCANMGEPVRNILFKGGKPIAGHDEILELFVNGKLLQALQVEKAKTRYSNKEFSGLLPIANY
ncbi:conserved hypothetical protein [Theileria equi strain WA]|uniref:Uncharacterized protein n=1 Tax=Theileria equi strain WA TaxID=1537102 RepID=L1LGF5_THEEQ|nr:conserved hypothetical protein [Theileria equi strain WA]EKX74223.1 conserved hypothetical protein [Theileria equi strain WA]|eukprot:XP_004833675.1 conserved hypothetical protein [Theileria equi strain WA]